MHISLLPHPILSLLVLSFCPLICLYIYLTKTCITPNTASMLPSDQNKQSRWGERDGLEEDLECPRCGSTNTKFCYYNNYSLSQPRYFCKTCRRHWTRGGALRNIPVGGGSRKNKKLLGFSLSKLPDAAPEMFNFFQNTAPIMDFQFGVDPPNPSFTVEPSNPSFTVQHPNPSFTVEPSNPIFSVEHPNPSFTVEPPNPSFTVEHPNPSFTAESNHVLPLLELGSNVVPTFNPLVHEEPQPPAPVIPYQEIGASSASGQLPTVQYYDNAYQFAGMSGNNSGFWLD